ncbi:TetR/AcrR family transcriptional regulator [Aliikangiella maris]|uniref:TetR/AcrR family transcriptional regulator n=2 Tax=Aliikangiella maris TaxID=3162458 RepID=A0ABV3MPU0_9GAMM
MNKPTSNKQVATKTKILDAAEELFAERGFAETSLRVITAKAEVNLASVNYHFGSKKSLIEAVFDRFMQSFTAQIMKEMAILEKNKSIDISQVLGTLVEPLMGTDNVRPNGASVFMKLLGRAYAESQGHIRRYVMHNYAHVLARFTRLLQKACPQIAASEMFWRLHFMLGAFIFTLAGHEALQDISQSDFEESVSTKDIILKLIPFLAAGFLSSNSTIELLSAGEA